MSARQGVPSRTRRTLIAAAVVVAAYLVVRAIVELFTVDFGDPASYRSDWGGPSLVGVLAAHCGPGFLIALAGGFWLIRHRRRRPNPPPG